MRYVLVISAILFLLIAPLVVVSNVLAQRPPPPPPPQHPGEATVVVVELVQFIVVAEVTLQATDVIPTILIVSPAATSDSGIQSHILTIPSSEMTAYTAPQTPLPSADTGSAGMDAIGLLAGSIAMLAAAVYVAIESKRRQGLTWLNLQRPHTAELNKQMRPLKTCNTHIWDPFEKEDAKYSLARAPMATDDGFGVTPPIATEFDDDLDLEKAGDDTSDAVDLPEEVGDMTESDARAPRRRKKPP